MKKKYIKKLRKLPSAEKLFNPREVAKILGIGEPKVRLLILGGDLQALDMNKRGEKSSYRMTIDMIQSFIKKNSA